MNDFKDKVVYQIYPKSFMDSNGDGFGDLKGVTAKLDYLADLGVDYLWLTPFFPSPQRDNGYDVADYRAVDPRYGTMEDLEELIREADRRGIGLMLDMVFNHTSTEHEWFKKALAGDKKYQDYYIFKDGTPDCYPTNWVSKFGGPAWEYVPWLGKWYLHLYDVMQADLNWENPAVREEMADILRFWKAKGIKGFRFDVINVISKPEFYEDDYEGDGRRFYTDGRNVHKYLKELVAAGGIDGMITVGEMSSTTLENCIGYTAAGNHELSMCFNFHHLKVDYKNGDKWATKPETYVCNGPYMISEWTPGERIVCKKNPNYKGGWDNSKIVTEQLTFLLLEDSSASYTAYTSGQALMIKDVPTEEIPSLKKSTDGGDFYVDPILGTYYLSMNLNKAPFNNVNVRKALSLAIDREYIANTIMQGTYSPAYNYVGPSIVDSGDGMFLDNAIAANGGSTYVSKDYQANLAEAKKALAEAGYPDGKGFPTITYSTNDSGYHKALAEYLQQVYKKELGINMKIDVVDWSSFTPQRRVGNYEMARNGWVMDYNDASNMIELFYSSNGNNDGKYNSKAFDAAMDKSKVADSKAHFEALHEAEKIMSEDYACIPVAYYNDFWLQSPTLKGTWHSPYGYWYFQYAYVEG